MYRILKKPSLLVCILLIVLAAFVNLSFQQSEPKLLVSPSIVERYTPALGTSFPVSIIVIQVFNLTGFGFKVNWNTTLLDLVGVFIPPFLNAPVIINANETNEPLGQYYLDVTSIGQPKTGNGTLVNLTFRITYQPTYPGSVMSDLQLTDTRLTGSSGSISHQVQNGEYWLHASPPLTIDIATEKPSYYLSESIPIYGNLTRGAIPGPVSDGVVAIEVEDPLGQTVLVRTLRTGSIVPDAQVEIIAVVPCDQNGVPKSSFRRATLAYFNVTVRNNDSVSLNVRIVLSIIDALNVPAGITYVKLPVQAGTTLSWLVSFPISPGAALGPYTTSTSVLSEWLKLSGVPYGPEKTAIFTVTASGYSTFSSQPATNLSPEGTFSITIRLPQHGSPPGIFKVYAASRNKGEDTRTSITFQVKIPDPNGDGVVDIYDLIIVGNAYGSTPGDPKWDSRADVIQDNVIDIYDLIMVANVFGWSP